MQGVVLRQTTGKGRIGDTDIRRDEVVAFGLVAQEPIDILHETQLRLDLRHRTLVRIAGLDEELRLYTEVRDVVMLFVGSYCIFSITQFIGDDSQPLLYESRRVGGNQVLIHHCIEVILLDELMQEGFVAFRHG